ncbi:lipid-A-disaccharide synthase N-terminal domain-containing protein [Tropicimonas sp. IMCC34011]|uniref:lipid-A-disaccharide synthase N-terminal domain-containing protein n=1 Tax=Tropicimonas sp. IMCC34011 TaxID=2248759 RepID=UPI000E2324CD|nr:lipid-A-disaccharide synthase N-terminal domain-containing protein [Tropicimonas sp. IMCC34011]
MIEAIFQFLHVDSMGEFLWVCVGFGGQLLFTARFLIQWIASEKAERSVVPVAFWYFSVLGGLVLGAYAVYRRDPVFMLGQGMGLFIYSRNLWLIHAEKRRHAE